MNAGATVVSPSHFTDNGEAIYHYCGQLRVVNDTATGGHYGVDASGCAAGDTLSVDGSSFSGLDSYGVHLLYGGRHAVTNSLFTDDNTGAYGAGAPDSIVGNQVIRPQSVGLSHYWSGPSAGISRISNNVVTCDRYGASYAGGVGLAHASSTVKDTLIADGNSVSNCNQGVYLSGAWLALADLFAWCPDLAALGLTARVRRAIDAALVTCAPTYDLAVPGALIGCAGPRVIEQTIRQKRPRGVQRSEFLLEHGFRGGVVDRRELKNYISNALDFFLA